MQPGEGNGRYTKYRVWELLVWAVEESKVLLQILDSNNLKDLIWLSVSEGSNPAWQERHSRVSGGWRMG